VHISRVQPTILLCPGYLLGMTANKQNPGASTCAALTRGHGDLGS
jgi:hypothetical protein